jgi:hypothetical protein
MGCEGNLDVGFIAIGTYYCSQIDQFGYVESGIVDPMVDGIGRVWRLLTGTYVNWMAGMLAKAMANDSVSDDELSLAISKYHAVRDRLLLECGVSLAEAYQDAPAGRAERLAEDSDNSDHTLAGEGREGGGGLGVGVGGGGCGGLGVGGASGLGVTNKDAPVRSAG